MNGSKKILTDRVLFCLFSLILFIAFAVLCAILKTDASYPAQIGAHSSLEAELPDETAPSVTQPSDAYERIQIHFLGTCTPASMLGSSTFGTFNQAYAANGADYFFRRLSERFLADDWTVAGCDAVFTDRQDLTLVQKTPPEWYKAPAKTADVFASGGIDALSIACLRALDYGMDGYADTKNALEQASLQWGDSGKAMTMAFPGGITAAVACSSYTSDHLPGLISWVGEAAAQYDFVALYMTDTDDSHTVSEEKKTAFRSLIDAGADLVVGTNGKKLQPAENYNGGFIAYSLGSILDGSSKYPEKYTALLQVELRADFGEIREVIYHLLPCITYQDEHAWEPRLIEEESEREAALGFLHGERETPDPQKS
ncbi:MAG: CapA family protein [Clostridia bacterium]|nr:CapA family protein [Clostridia bacterium]